MKQQYAVMGNPIEHSLSPMIHEAFARQTGVKLVYDKRLVALDAFEEEVAAFFSAGGAGLNITLPFKERAYLLAAEVSARAKLAKAANTLWVSKGQLLADNTDGAGLIQDLSTWVSLQNMRVLILGAGGAARGIIAPLLQEKVKALWLTNRTVSKLSLLADDFPGLNTASIDALDDTFDLIINATPSGLLMSEVELPTKWIHPATVCYDLAYGKQETPFVAWAKKQGVQAKDGLGMLVYQAAEAFYIWQGIRPDAFEVLQALRFKRV